MEHVTIGSALCKWKKIARKNCGRNARMPALGYRAVQEKGESQEAPYFIKVLLHKNKSYFIKIKEYCYV